MLLVLATGWGGSAYGVRFEPTFEDNLNKETDSWYYIHFVNRNANGFMYAQADGAHFKHGNNSVQNPAYFWQLIGDKNTGFKLVSMSGEYAYWNNDFLSGTSDANQAAVFHLLNGTDADSWAIERHAASGTRNCLNPQGSNEIKTWSNDNGCRIQFKVATTEDLETAKGIAFPDMGILGNHVELVFQDNLGNSLADQTVVYTPEAGAPVSLTSSMAFYDFGDVDYNKNLFSLTENYKSLKVAFDNDAQRLTFTITQLPNVLRYSSAPSTTGWDANTHWYTIQNNRSNQPGHNYKYLSTAASSVNDNYTLKASIAALENNVGEAWAFVGTEDGIQIYNAAYGPDFVLGSSSSGDNANANFKMVLKDNPEGYFTTFTAVPNSVLNAPSTHSYAFRVGKTGNVHIHITNGTLRTWNHSGAIVGSNNDGGSSFTITAIEEATFNALTPCDVYKAQWSGATTSDFEITYNHSGSTFGRRSAVSDGAFFIVNHDSPVALGDFTTTVSAEYALGSVTVKNNPDHAYRILDFFIKDAKATEEWTVNVNGGYIVSHVGTEYTDGQTFFIRPGVTPSALDFTINAPADKFVWGPVFDTQAKTVTYDVRDLAPALTTGWYQLQIADNAAAISSLASQIKPKAGNINTPANTLYLAPSVYEPGNNRLFKVTGVPTYASEAATFVYIRDNGYGNYTFIHPSNGKELTALGFTFADGCLTKSSNWSYESTAHPLEGPYLLPDGNQRVSFNVASVDLSNYDVYQVNIVGSGALSDVRLNVNSASVLSNNVVATEGFIFMKKGSNVPVRSQFGVQAGNVTISSFVIGDKAADGTTPITIGVIPRQSLWTVRITGDAKRAEDRVIYNSLNYNDGDMVGVPFNTIPTALDFKTNVTDRFVWGPVINEKDYTVSFEIKTPVDVNAASDNLFNTDGWYQFMLVPYTTKGANFINTINQVSTDIKSRKGSYIYMFNAEKEFEQNVSNHYPMKFAAVPASGDQATSYFFVKHNGRTPQFQALNGHYVHNSGYMSTTPANMQGMDAINNSDIYGQNIYGVYRWSNYDNTGAERPFVGASGTNLNYYVRAVKVNPTDNYDVYQVVLSGTNQNMVRYIGNDNRGVNELYNNGYLLLSKDASAPNKDDFYFDSITSIDGITITDNVGKKVITFTVSSRASGYTNTIIHRQHDVYDRIAVADENLLPKGSHIKRGRGMIEHPMKDGFPSGYTENDCLIQNTSVFHVTQYTKPGLRTECILPFTKGKSTEQGHVSQYQRWYDYQTELPLDDDIITLADGTSSTLGNFYKFTNGHCNYNANGNKLYNVFGKADIKLPIGSTDIYVGVDASEFSDLKTVNGNLVEPSLNMRVIYHIISAHKMAAALTTTGNKWWEEREYVVPNIKRGSDTYRNNADLIPLDMPFCNYWIYKTTGNTDDSNLMPIVAENDNYSTLKRNLEIVIEGSAREYLEVGVFDGNPGNIGSAPYINGNHFLYYKIKGNAVTRIVPAGTQAVIKVYAKDGNNNSSPKYQLFKFTLNFQGATEPLAITSVVGNPASTRSVDYFINNGFKESASLTFKNKDAAFTRIPGHRADGNEGVTYAFPIDFSRTSYGYSPNNTFGNYRVTTKGYGIQYRPVSLYEHNIANRTNTSMKCADDYFFYIDAAESPGQVASITLDGTLCVGSRLYCYGWFGSTNYYNGNGSPSGASVLLQVVGRRSDGTEEVIASYLPGTLTDVSYDNEGDEMRSLTYGCFPSQQQAGWMDLNATQVGVWNNVGFSFVVKDVAFVSYDLRIINNCFSTSGGDYALDDFRVFVSPPKGNVDFTTPLCTDALRHVKVHTDYDMLVESSGVNTLLPGATIPVSFCFLNKEVYDEMTKDYYNIDTDGNRTLKADVDYENPTIKAIFNTAFGDALIGERTIDKNVKGHGFHNFVVPVDYESIPIYAYNDSPDDQIFKEEKDNGERRIVFKEQLYQSTGEEHQWEPGKSYYLLFAPYHVTNEHLMAHDIGTEMFHISDQCCVLTTFSIMPPIEVKGDATITSSDQVKACDNQVITFKVDMPALKLNDDAQTVSDVVISGLNYDWWVGTSKANATHAGFLAASHGMYASIEDARRYNHKSVDDYPNDADVDRNVYLHSALGNVRFYFPEARRLDEFELVAYDNDNGYGVVQEHLDCLAHYLEPLADGRKPLSLFGQTFNLKVSHAEADANHKQHFVAIPIIPEQDYGVNEKLIYCPAPQELIIHVADQAPNLQNGFGNMPYPDYIVNVPIRIGKQQIEGVRKEAELDLVGNTLYIPLRKIIVVDGSSTKLMAKDHETELFGSIYLAATDDNYYSFDTEGGEFTLRRVAQVIDIKAEKSNAEDGYMKITFTRDFPVREGCTYTLKLPYVEDVACQCEGTLVFDIKVVPEYQVWTASAGNSDWTNDRNWRRADREELHAGAEATGNGMQGATPLNNATSYVSNVTNTTDGSFVPMYFTNVLFKRNSAEGVELYKGGSFRRPALGTRFLEGLEPTATEGIIYDMAVTPINPADRTSFNYDCNYECELFDTYIAHGVTFEPSAQMGNAHYLTYNKAWVEYELDANRWYTIASPLKHSVAGDWYSPTAGGKQLTPHFYDINYREDLNDRFRPAYYQRSWDRDGNNIVYTKAGGTYDSYVRADWSNVYNDATVNYSNGGFSVKAELDYMDPADRPADDKVLVRLPKADTSYTYYDVEGFTGQAGNAEIGARTDSYRLLSDNLGADGTGSIAMSVSNQTTDNNFLLLSNPFMAAMDMDKFFAANPDLEEKYWIVDADRQMVSVKSAANGEWITTGDTGGKYVAPLQGFFVKKNDSAPAPGFIRADYTAEMQTVVNPDPVNPGVALRAPSRATVERTDIIRLTAERDGKTSTALIVFNDNADDGYAEGEDCEALVDDNLSAYPFVYTSAGATAQTINVRKTLQMIPVGIISSDDSATTLHFDLSESSRDTFYLYDRQDDTYTTIFDGTDVTMSGNNSGRYFIVSGMNMSLDEECSETDEDADIYSLHGIRVASPQHGTVIVRGNQKKFIK